MRNPIFKFSNYHIITSAHYHIITLSHQHIITLSHYHIVTLSHYHIITSSHYALLKLFTGLLTAAFIAWKLTVANAINITNIPAEANIHQLNEILYG